MWLETRLTRVSIRGRAPHRNSSFAKLTKKSERTWYNLGPGEHLASHVRAPPSFDPLEWIAANTMDFHSEIAHLWIICESGTKRYTEPGSGFPKGFCYYWKDSKGRKEKVPSPEYVNRALRWIESLFEDLNVFPVAFEEDDVVIFPDQFVDKYVIKIWWHYFNIFAIIFTRFLDTLKIVPLSFFQVIYLKFI